MVSTQPYYAKSVNIIAGRGGGIVTNDKEIEGGAPAATAA